MKLILPIAIALSLTLNIQAQQLYRNKASVNFGLTKPMAQTELPYSKASLILPERVSKVETESRNWRRLMMLSSVWETSSPWTTALARGMTLLCQVLFLQLLYNKEFILILSLV